jgi:hypothetical protein
MAANTMKKWMSSANNKAAIEYIMSVDEDDAALDFYEGLVGGKHLLCNRNKTTVEAVNRAAATAKGNVLIVVSDDFDCPFHWDEGLLKALEGKEDFVAKTHDGLQPFIVTLPVMDRKYYERFRYIYNPVYQHMFCDTELTAVAYMLGKMEYVAITFPHHHYTTGRNKRDAINIKNDATWAAGEAIYKHRQGINFGLENIVHAYPKNKL